MSTRLALFLMKELALEASLLPGVKMEPILRMMDLLYFSLLFCLMAMERALSSVEMVISVGGTQVDQEFAVSKV